MVVQSPVQVAEWCTACDEVICFRFRVESKTTEEVSLADLGGEAAKFHKPGTIENESILYIR